MSSNSAANKSLAAIAVKEVETDKAKSRSAVIAETKQGRMPSALVAMSRTDLSLLQQKIFASLIYAVTTGKAERTPQTGEIAKASEQEDVIDDWRIDPKRLKELSRFESRNHEHFRKSIEGLSGRIVELNILGKDDEVLLHTKRSLFEGIGFGKKDGKVYFAFSDYVKRKLNRFRFYCKFFPSYANSLKHNSSHAIYLLLLDYIDENRGEGQTPFIEIEKFAKLVGGEAYSDFGTFRENCIKPAIIEIAKKTNVEASFDRLDDVKTIGRKVTAIRIRGRFKKGDEICNVGVSHKSNAKHKRQSSLFDESEVTLFGHTIDKDSFLDFLSTGATKSKSAYKHQMQIALDNGTLGDIKERVIKYISFKLEQEKIIKVEKQNRKVNEFYKRLSEIALKAKQDQLENLYIWNEANGFVSFSSIVNEHKLLELCSDLIDYSDNEIARKLFTNNEKRAMEAREKREYMRSILNPLIAIAPRNEWYVVSNNGEKSKVFYSATIQQTIGDIASLALLRSINRTLVKGEKVEFEAEGHKHFGSFDSNRADGVMALAKQASDDESKSLKDDTSIETNDSAINAFSEAQAHTASINDGNTIAATRRE
jgi:hypothetical protein